MKKLPLLLLALAALSQPVQAELVAHYTFGNDNLLEPRRGPFGFEVPKSSPGSNLRTATTNLIAATSPSILQGRNGVVAIPKETGFGVRNPGLQEDWSMSIVFAVPPDSSQYRSFFSFVYANGSDAALFVKNNSQIGCSNYDDAPDMPGSWHQLTISSSGNVQSVWYDTTRLSDRAWDVKKVPFFWFGLDNNGDDNLIYFDEIRLYDTALAPDLFDATGTPILLAPASDAPYSDEHAAFSRTPDKVVSALPFVTYAFSSPGTFDFTNKGACTASALLVGGGGAGGLCRGGGGGGGGVFETNGVPLAATNYTIRIGAGGIPYFYSKRYNDYYNNRMESLSEPGETPVSASGGDTALVADDGTILLCAAGGGGGGNFVYSGGHKPALSGGLPGGSSGGNTAKCTTIAAWVEGQGHGGGAAQTENGDNSGGGGGGADAPGDAGTAATPGAGGGGVKKSLSGTGVWYGGGGGGSSANLLGAPGGQGGGGKGVDGADRGTQTTSANGADGLGGGGGGGSGFNNNPYHYGGGRGGNGAFVLRLCILDEEETAPTIGIATTEVGYTNATIEVTLVSPGAGATSADVSVSVSANADMSEPIFETALGTAASGFPAVFSVPYHPFATNATYYARASAVNDRNIAGTSLVFAFTTLLPGPPVVSVQPYSTGFSMVSAMATIDEFGIGGESADLYLDCSEADDFAEFASSPATPVSSVPFSQVLTTSGLRGGTNYHYRVRAVNNWGVVGVSPILSTWTKPFPVQLSPISASPAPDDSEMLSVSTSAIESGTVYSVSASIDGSTVKTWTGLTETNEFSVSFAGAGGSHTATFRVSATLGGKIYTDARTLAFTIGGIRVVVTDYAAHASAATAIRIHAGDSIALPEIPYGWSYRVLNERVLSLDGLDATALEPAVAGIEVWNGDTLETTIAVLVLPEAIEGGDVYVYDETVSIGDRVWNDAAAWDKIGSATDSEWPCNPNDVAVIPFYATTGDTYLRHMTDLSVGGILFGQFRDVTARCILERHKNAGSTKTVTFSRTDGEPAFAKVTSNTTSSRENVLRFGGYDILLECASSVETDACSSPKNDALNRGSVTYSACTIHIPEGLYWSVDGLPGFGLSRNSTIGMPNLSGEGVFHKRGMGGIQIRNLPGFTGTIVDSSHGNLGSFDRAGPTFWHGPGGTNVTIAVAGWVSPRLGAPSVASAGYGWLRTGWEPGYDGSDIWQSKTHGDAIWFPRKGLLFHGGAYAATSTENGGWGVGVRETKITERLLVGAGFSLMSVGDNRANSGGHPINYFEAAELLHEEKGSFVLADGSRRYVAASQSSTNDMVVILGHASHLVGHGQDGDCLSTDVYPIIPWIVAPTSTDDSSWRNTLFASFDADGRLTRPIWNNTALDAAASPFSNAYLWDKTIEIGSDVTVNSLFMNNSGKNKWLGKDRTLTITSGGLVLHGKNTAIGQPGRADNGSLVLGDADHPAYVFAKSSDLSQPNQIWAPVTAPGGFVASYSGALVLGGNQTNILDELVVNAGVLSLGTDVVGCSLAKNLPIRVCAGATLVAPRPDAVKRSALWFDGAGGQFGRVELPDGVAAQCKKAWWRDYPRTPEWRSLPRGVYGSSDSGVAGEFVRDDLFAGTGTLRIVADDRIPPTILILR